MIHLEIRNKGSEPVGLRLAHGVVVVGPDETHETEGAGAHTTIDVMRVVNVGRRGAEETKGHDA